MNKYSYTFPTGITVTLTKKQIDEVEKTIPEIVEEIKEKNNGWGVTLNNTNIGYFWSIAMSRYFNHDIR